MLNLGIIDFGIGNLKSIIYILKKIKFDINLYLINKNFKNFNIIDKIIIPGQGSSYTWLKNLLYFDFENLWNILKIKKVFGICVGKHIFFENTEEFKLKNIGVIKGYIKKYDFEIKKKIPHIGWNKVFFLRKHYLLKNIKNINNFYFSNSFYSVCYEKSDFIYGLSKYFEFFPSVIIKNDLILTQFHPEKSYKQGLNFFYNFCTW